MININLPEKFQEKLKTVQDLHGIVLSTAAGFGELLVDNKLYFFEEYTDHGVKHIESILVSTSNLVTEKTFDNILSGKDIGSFILSTILHDIAMHITLEGFNQLLNGCFDDVRVKELDKFTWAQLWEEYLNEAKKFSGKQLIAIFGDQDIIIRNPLLLNKGEINGNDKKLIGEFIRRHHPRLAHEIALKGFPGKNEPLEFARELDYAHKKLIGLIARSHGLDLRSCVNYIESEYGIKGRTYIHGIHVAYLMILLRLADYLQIDKTRTSPILLKVKSLSSPFSELEHQTHLAIDSIDTEYQVDPERIFVQASPKESKMYLKILKLLQDIQHEFDISWAVLGELYGSINNKAEIKYRRITSNLHEISFRNKQEYVADKFYFKSNDEIAKLLISPLYSNQPKYGVRELLQNAVDACREREIIEKGVSNDYRGEIDINIFKTPDGDNYFEIKDNGIGMPIEVIKDYFLTAGASYRRSLNWQKAFTDVNGNSSVTRSGRFGVGVLAAFLIGKGIYVETKNIKEDIGYKFYADLNESQINVLKDDTLKTGTIVRIKIDDDKLHLFAPTNPDYKQARYDWTLWYALPDPVINYFYFGKRIIPAMKLGPNPQNATDEWRSLNSKGYNKIFWTHDESYGYERSFICNGIVIPDVNDSSNFVKFPPFNTAKISVIDNNGVLPLTLNRNNLSDYVSFDNDLNEDMYKDFLAYILLFSPRCAAMGPQIKLGHQYLQYPALSGHRMNEFLLTRNGFLLNANYTLNKFRTSNSIELISKNLHFNHRSINLDIQGGAFTYQAKDHVSIYSDITDLVRLRRNMNISTRVFIQKETHDLLFRTMQQSAGEMVRKEVTLEYDKHNIASLAIGSPGKSIITECFLKEYNNNIVMIKECRIPPTEPLSGTFDILLKKYLGENVVIPYNLKERKPLYPLAFEELEYYMLKHKARINRNGK